MHRVRRKPFKNTPFCTACLVIALAVMAMPAGAADERINVDVLVGSTHFVERADGKPWQESNPGIGVSAPGPHDLRYNAGVYRNSYDDTSAYAAIERRLVGHGPVSLGVMVGAVSGYERLDGCGFVCAGALPVIEVSVSEHIKARGIIAPGYFAALQFRF